MYNEVKTKAMFFEASGKIRHPLVRLGDNRVCIDEYIAVLGVRMDRKKLYVEHAKRVRDRMSEVSKITRFCRN